MNMEICNAFLKSVVDMLREMVDANTGTDAQFYPESNEILSKGVCTIINFEGKIKGRLMLDMVQKSALNLVKSITGRQYETAKEMSVLSAIAELNNTIAGDAVTNLNNKYFLCLKLSPPTVLASKEALICSDKIPSCSVTCKTTFGDIKVNIAFNEEEWVNG
jgi:CheY-specific phosphatase CheX